MNERAKQKDVLGRSIFFLLSSIKIVETRFFLEIAEQGSANFVPAICLYNLAKTLFLEASLQFLVKEVLEVRKFKIGRYITVWVSDFCKEVSKMKIFASHWSSTSFFNVWPSPFKRSIIWTFSLIFSQFENKYTYVFPRKMLPCVLSHVSR